MGVPEGAFFPHGFVCSYYPIFMLRNYAFTDDIWKTTLAYNKRCTKFLLNSRKLRPLSTPPLLLLPPLISRGYGGPFVDDSQLRLSLALGGDAGLGGNRATVTAEKEWEEDGKVQEPVVTVGKRKKWRADRVSRRQM